MKKLRFDFVSESGGALVELVLSLALVALVMPFLFGYQERAITRAQNIAVAREMADIQNALELYITAHRTELLQTVGRNITRVDLSELAEFGANENVIEKSADKYQLRILKSSDERGRASLQGVIVLANADITPLRTREIVEIGGDNMGFIDGNRAYGTFGAWRTNAIDLGVNVSDALVRTTTINRNNSLYLARVPTDSADDATMSVGLNLGGHDIINASLINAANVQFQETLATAATSAKTAIFKNRTAISKDFQTTNATVAGVLTSDSRTLDVAGNFSLADTAKFSSLSVDDLWTTNLTLSGLSISSDTDIALMRVNNAVDMTAGRITAMYVTVGFAGSVTPKLIVRERITDSVNPSYYWDASTSSANLSDATLGELNRLAPMVVRWVGGGDGAAAEIFNSVSTNRNATVADYMNAIREIQTRVRAEYRLLNLE